MSVPGEITTPAPNGDRPDNNDDDDPGDKDQQTYPAGGIIGAGTGAGASIEIPGQPTTPDPATAPTEPNPTPEPPKPGTSLPADPGHTPHDPANPDQATPAEDTPSNPLLGLAEGILHFFFPQPTTPDTTTGPQTPDTPGTRPGGTTTGTGTNTADNTVDTGGGDGAETPGTQSPDTNPDPGDSTGGTSADPSGVSTRFSAKDLATAAAGQVYSDEIAAAVAAVQKEAAAQSRTRAELDAAQQRLIKQGNEAPATVATVTALGPLLAEHDQRSWEAADEHLKQIAERLGIPVEQLAISDERYQYPMSAIPTNSEHSPAERVRELRLHIKWMNSQTFEETTDRMDNPKRSSNDVTKARQDFQNDWKADSYDSMVEMGYTPEQAEKLSASIVERLMKRLVITHNPDMVAGGPADLLITFGDKRTNSSLGPSHRAAAAAYRQWLDAQKAKNPDAIVRVDFTPGFPLPDPAADEETDD